MRRCAERFVAPVPDDEPGRDGAMLHSPRVAVCGRRGDGVTASSLKTAVATTAVRCAVNGAQPPAVALVVGRRDISRGNARRWPDPPAIQLRRRPAGCSLAGHTTAMMQRGSVRRPRRPLSLRGLTEAARRSYWESQAAIWALIPSFPDLLGVPYGQESTRCSPCTGRSWTWRPNKWMLRSSAVGAKACRIKSGDRLAARPMASPMAPSRRRSSADPGPVYPRPGAGGEQDPSPQCRRTCPGRPATPEATARGKVARGSCPATRPGACRRWRGKCRGPWRSGRGSGRAYGVLWRRRACRRPSRSAVRRCGPAPALRRARPWCAHG